MTRVTRWDPYYDPNDNFVLYVHLRVAFVRVPCDGLNHDVHLMYLSCYTLGAVQGPLEIALMSCAVARLFSPRNVAPKTEELGRSGCPDTCMYHPALCILGRLMPVSMALCCHLFDPGHRL